jgi:ABC-2 type transport system ATP-binding protein
MDAIIELHQLTKCFGRKIAVNRLTFQVPRGAIFAFLGDNGAGKTTTIKMLTGLLEPDAGSAFILGRHCWRAAAPLRRHIGYVPERPRFYDWMTVAEIGWFTSGFHHHKFLSNYHALIRRFDLDPDQRLQSLSKGQYAKVGLALALAPDPEVLILDEPTSGLDLLVRREFLSSMVELAGEGRTILISSHQIQEVERIASHVAFLAQGQLLLTTTMDELRKRLVRLQLRHDGRPPDASRLGQVLQRNGTGKQWEAVILDPVENEIAALQFAEGVSDFEQSPLSLEEAYCALLEQREEQP